MGLNILILIIQEQIEQQKIEEQQRDLGLARLGALGALNDLEHQDMMYEGGQEHAFNNSINFHELNMLNSNRNNLVIKVHNALSKYFLNVKWRRSPYFRYSTIIYNLKSSLISYYNVRKTSNFIDILCMRRCCAQLINFERSCLYLFL